MRLLIDVSAVPARPVGAGVYTVELARELARRDTVELHLVSRRDDAERWQPIAPGATVHAEVPPARPARLAWEQTRAPRLATRLGVDVWHGPHYTLPVRLTVPSVVTVHDLTFFEHPEWHERSKVAFFRRMIRSSTARAGAIVAVSGHTRDRLAAVLAPSAPVIVAVHGVDHERFTPVDHDDRARLAAIGIRPPYVAFAATIEPRKDVPSLIDAFARLAPRHPDLTLVIAGRDGWGAVAVREAAARSGCTTRIARVGWMDDAVLPAFFRQAEVVAYPSLEEGFGLPALEALACGAALVTTTGSAMEEVVDDAALLVRPRDPAGLARAIETLLDDPAERDRRRAAGPMRASDFTWSASVDQHLLAYEQARSTGSRGERR
ncbi:MAG: glycosyltransferase family 4 protein [Acidimicrobiia bacterium]